MRRGDPAESDDDEQPGNRPDDISDDENDIYVNVSFSEESPDAEPAEAAEATAVRPRFKTHDDMKAYYLANLQARAPRAPLLARALTRRLALFPRAQSAAWLARNKPWLRALVLLLVVLLVLALVIFAIGVSTVSRERRVVGDARHRRRRARARAVRRPRERGRPLRLRARRARRARARGQGRARGGGGPRQGGHVVARDGRDREHAGPASAAARAWSLLGLGVVLLLLVVVFCFYFSPARSPTRRARSRASTRARGRVRQLGRGRGRAAFVRSAAYTLGALGVVALLVALLALACIVRLVTPFEIAMHYLEWAALKKTLLGFVIIVLGVYGLQYNRSLCEDDRAPDGYYVAVICAGAWSAVYALHGYVAVYLEHKRALRRHCAGGCVMFALWVVLALLAVARRDAIRAVANARCFDVLRYLPGAFWSSALGCDKYARERGEGAYADGSAAVGKPARWDAAENAYVETNSGVGELWSLVCAEGKRAAAFAWEVRNQRGSEPYVSASGERARALRLPEPRVLPRASPTRCESTPCSRRS